MSDQDLGGIEGALWSFPMNNNNKNHSGLLTKMYCKSVRSKKYVAAISFLTNHLFTSVLTSLRVFLYAFVDGTAAYYVAVTASF